MLSMVIDSISSFMYSKLLIIMLIGAGVYFTIRTRFPQVRLFRSACKAVMEKPDDKEAVSSFQALMVSTASRVGTGWQLLRRSGLLYRSSASLQTACNRILHFYDCNVCIWI